MVSIVIGRNGTQIKRLQAKTRTEVFISSAKREQGTQRCAQVKGKNGRQKLRTGERHRGGVQVHIPADRRTGSIRGGEREAQGDRRRGNER